MDFDTIGFALAAGLVAAVNPCGFAMLPAYLTLVVVGEDGQRSKATAMARALGATAMMALGFLLVFGTFGLVIAPLATSVVEYLPAVTVVIGVALVGLGAWMLSGRELTLLVPKPGRGVPTARLGSMFGSAVIRGARRLMPQVNRISGVLLLVVGLYVAYYGVYELRLYLGGGPASDPVVDAAGQLQGVLVGWVDRIGPVPLLVVLAGLVLGAVLLTRRRARQ